jgi:hypothetical protein
MAMSSKLLSWKNVLLLMLGFCCGLTFAQTKKRDVVGVYYLQGVRELGSQIALQANGDFEYFLSYGGADQTAKGKWRQEGETVVLQTQASPPPSFTKATSLPHLIGDYAQPDAKPSLVLVKISTPSRELVWSNMLITAEFSNGKTRSGNTGRNGMLAFSVRTDPEWQGATILRIAVEYPEAKVPKRWFPIESPDVKTLQIEFEPGNLVADAFESMKLNVQVSANKNVELVTTENITSRRYTRR